MKRYDGGLIGRRSPLMVEIDLPEENHQKSDKNRHADERGDATSHVRGASNRCAFRIPRHESDRHS
jgi:hypothetical protein